MPLTCAETYNNRTAFITVNNRSRYTLLDMLVRLIDLSGNVSPGFVADTGFFIVSSSQGPGTVVSIDPCSAGGASKPCQATKIEWTYRIATYGGEFPPRSGATSDVDHSTYYSGLTLTQDDFIDAAEAVTALIVPSTTLGNSRM